MRHFAIGVASAGLLTLAAALPVDAAMTVSPYAGAWHWNKDESHLIQGAAPLDLVLEIKNFTGHGHTDYNRVQSSLTITYPDGTQRIEGYDGAFDGKPYPVRGRDDGATRSYTVGPDGALQSEFKSPKAAIDAVSTCTLSPDSKKMTCKGTAQDTAGKPADFVVVYDRIVSAATKKK
ncbi:MAG: hypothetical protein ACHQF3_06950 [Alphaproteobacteria bacterium]